MKRRLFQSLAGLTSSGSDAQEDIKSIRVKSLNLIYQFGIVLGFFALAADLPSTISQNQTWMAVITIGLYLVIVAFGLIKRIPFILRTIVFLLVVYVIGLSSLLDSGLSGTGRVFITTLPLLSAVMLGIIGGGVAMLISLITLLGVGFGMSNGMIQPPTIAIMANSSELASWLTSTLVMLLMIALTGISLVTLVMGLDRASKRQKILAGQLAEERASLEKTVDERTASLQRRLVQIRTAAEISRVTSLSQSADELLDQVLNLIKEQFNLYYTGIFLTEPTGQYAELRAGTGEAGQMMLAARHRLQIGEASMIGWSILKRQARIALDVGEEAVRFNNPYLPDTRSEIALPLIVREKALGALTLQSEKPGAFDQDDITVLQSIADVVATSLENSRLFQESQETLAEISSLHQKYLEQKWADLSYSAEDLSFTFEGDASKLAGNTATARIDLPLTLRDQVIGNISVDTDRNSLSTEEAAFIDAITTQTALALENARLLEETQRQVGREQTLNEISSRLNRSTSVEDILKTAVQELGKLASVTEASVYLSARDAAGASLPVNKNGNVN